MTKHSEKEKRNECTWKEANLRGHRASIFCIYLKMTSAELAFQITSRGALQTLVDDIRSPRP